jgi:hypothetical protein
MRLRCRITAFLLLAPLPTSCTGGVSTAMAVVVRCAALHCRFTVFSDEMRMVMTIMVFEIARHKLHSRPILSLEAHAARRALLSDGVANHKTCAPNALGSRPAALRCGSTRHTSGSRTLCACQMMYFCPTAFAFSPSHRPPPTDPSTDPPMHRPSSLCIHIARNAGCSCGTLIRGASLACCRATRKPFRPSGLSCVRCSCLFLFLSLRSPHKLPRHTHPYSRRWHHLSLIIIIITLTFTLVVAIIIIIIIIIIITSSSS